MKRLVILSLAAAGLMPAYALEFKLERDMPYYPEGVLAQEHAARHDAARDEDGKREPPDGVEAEDVGVDHQGADDAA